MLRVNIMDGPRYEEVLPSNVEVLEDKILISRAIKGTLLFIEAPLDADFTMIERIIKLDNELFSTVASVNSVQ